MHNRTWLFLALTFFIFTPFNVTAANIKTVTTPNNITAWLIEEHSIPIVSIRLAFKQAGGSYTPDGKEGLPYITSNLLTEGAGELDHLAFQKKLEEHAIYLSTSVDKGHLYVNLKTLKKNLPTAFSLLSDMLISPRFDTSAIEIMKEKALTSLTKKMESPHYLASLNWNKTVFKTHPYNKDLYGTQKTLPTFTRDDILTWYNNHISKQNIIVSAVGDITESELSTLLTKTLDKLPNTPARPVKQIEEFTDYPAASTRFIEFDKNPQAVILFGMPGLHYTHPDFYSAYILNYILGGGGFESRLMDEIREKRGLAYSASSQLNVYEKSSTLIGAIATKNESVDEVISLLKQQLTALANEGITEQEFNDAKSYLIGSFALRMDTNDKLVNFLMYMQLENMGIDFLVRRNTLVENVTQEDIKKIAKKLLNQKLMTIVAVGDFQTQ